MLLVPIWMGAVVAAVLCVAYASRRSFPTKSPKAECLPVALAPGSHAPQNAGSAARIPLPPSIAAEVTTNVEGHFSFYLEDLTSGNSCGMDADHTYDAWSLMKVVTLVTVLKKVERHELSLDDNVILLMDKPEPATPAAATDRKYCHLSVSMLMSDMIELSDNVAAAGLSTTISASAFQESLRATGMPSSVPGDSINPMPRVSPRQFANLLRSLESASYLNESDSAMALPLLANTVYDDQLRAGPPRDILVAHKVGFNVATGDYHDCGIVYLPHRPYILCIMSTGTNLKEADRVISTLSKRVYDFMASAFPPHA